MLCFESRHQLMPYTVSKFSLFRKQNSLISIQDTYNRYLTFCTLVKAAFWWRIPGATCTWKCQRKMAGSLIYSQYTDFYDIDMHISTNLKKMTYKHYRTILLNLVP